MIIKLTNDNYREVLDDLTKPKIAVVKIGASWCGPCKLIKPHYERWSENHKDEEDVSFYEVDNDECPDFVREYKIDSLPSILFFVYGMETFSIRQMTTSAIFDGVLEKVREIRAEIS